MKYRPDKLVKVAKIMKKFRYFLFCFYILTGYSFAEQPPVSLRLNLINEAYTYLNSPYQYAGNNYQGIDCSGLICNAAAAVNIALPRRVLDIANFALKISTEEVQPGDLLFFNTVGKNVSHIGLYIGNNEFIHSASVGSKTGVIISSLKEKYWETHFSFAGRILPPESIFKNNN